MASKFADQDKKYVRELVTNERAIAALQKEFHADIKELNRASNMVIDAHKRKQDDVDKLTSLRGRG